MTTMQPIVNTPPMGGLPAANPPSIGNAPVPNPETLVRLKEVIRAKTGIDLGNDKDYLIPARLGSLLREAGFSSYDELAAALLHAGDTQLHEQFVERIATHETLFFRDESIYAALTTQIIPEWLNRNHANSLRKIRIWSAAAATGQEPYSVAMVIRHLMPQVFDRVEIFATDICGRSIARAREGLYSAYEVGRGVSPAYLERFFTESDGRFRVCEEIRNSVQFGVRNLLESPYPGDFDVILCRNVLIYFETQLRINILSGLRSALRPDGVLILGSAESVDGYVANYVLRECGLARYYDLNPSRVTLFR